MRYLVAAVLAATFATPAIAQEGPVTVWFSDEPAAVSDKLALLCADRNATVIEQDDRHLVCQREVSGGKGILAQAMLGNSASTAPQLMIRFALLRDRKAVRVQASQWVELQMAGGQTRRTDLNNRKQRVELENVLIGAGAHNVPPDDLDEPAAATPRPAAD
jgi:hypothetical protein